jgi:hypothetical protein
MLVGPDSLPQRQLAIMILRQQTDQFATSHQPSCHGKNPCTLSFHFFLSYEVSANVTPQGWRKLGSGMLTSSGGKSPGMVVPAAVAIATANPIGLIVVGGYKIYGEASGKNTPEGRAKATADAISEQLKIRFQDRGWIS